MTFVGCLSCFYRIDIDDDMIRDKDGRLLDVSLELVCPNCGSRFKTTKIDDRYFKVEYKEG